MTAPAVRVSRAGAICRAVLNEPDKLNPLSERVRNELRELCRTLEDDLDTRVLLLAGEGRAFSAGADLRGPLGGTATAAPSPDDSRGSAWSRRRHRAGDWGRLLDAIERLPQVTVARLHGPVIGGAVLLAAACDLRVAADDLRVSIPEVALGIPLTWAGLPRLAGEIGLPRTRDLVMTGRTIGAAEALAWGLVTRVAPSADLDGEVDRLLAELVAMPDAPLRLTRDALRAIGRETPGRAAAWADPDLLSWSQREPESREAAQRYVEQRLQRRGR